MRPGEIGLKFYALVLFFWAVAAFGCGGVPDMPPDPAGEGVGVEAPHAGIPVYPGARRAEFSGDYSFAGEGVIVSSYETDDPILRVYGFYTNHYSESSMKASGSIRLGDRPHFLLEVTRDGSDVAIIQGGEEDGSTYIDIWHSIGG